MSPVNCTNSTRHTWAQDSGDKFIMVLNSTYLIGKMLEFRENQYDTTKVGVNMATADVNTLFHKAAIKANRAKIKRYTRTSEIMKNGLTINVKV